MKNTLIAAMLALALISHASAQELNRGYHQGETFELNRSIPNDEDNTYTAINYIKLLPGFASRPESQTSSLLNLGLDDLGIYPPENGYTNGSGHVVGSLGGTVNVGAMGGLNYSVPLQIPAGINGMQPNISIEYNSQGGNGLLGWGWDLGGLSSITRTGQTLYHDGQMTAANLSKNDRFILDGQRLILIHGSYGSANSEYRTENDRMAKIMLLADETSKDGIPSLYFKVWEMSGDILEYRARLFSPDGTTEILWMLSSVTDRYGNAVVFHYNGNIQTGEMRIDSIGYTANESQNVGAQFRIDFQYDINDRFDYECHYMGGCRMFFNDLLDGIKIVEANSGKPVYSYKFNYIKEFDNNKNRQYCILSSVVMSAYDENGNEEGFNPTTINWNTTMPDYVTKKQVTTSGILEEFPFLGDFNGDGYTDIATVPYKPSGQSHYNGPVDIKVHLNDRNCGFTHVGTMDFIGIDSTLEWVYVLDIDNDGLDDIVPYFSSFEEDDDHEEDGETSIKIYHNEGSSFRLIGTKEIEARSCVVTGDFDGNGTADIVMLERQYHGFYHGYWSARVYFTYLENIHWIGYRDGRLTSQRLNTRSIGKRVGPLYDAVPLDYNGDGISEVLLIGVDSDYIDNYGSRLAMFDFSSTETGLTIQDTYTSSPDPVYNYPNNWSHVFPGDYNGDGKTDIIYNSQSMWLVRFSNGNSLGPCKTILRDVIRPINSYRNIFAPSLKLASNVSGNNKMMMSVADFDGDGCSDFCYAAEDNNKMFVLSRLEAPLDLDPLQFRRKNKLDISFNFRSQFTHIGNFLGEDHASFLETVEPSDGDRTGSAYFLSPVPVTVYNSVSSITEGMGNSTSFTYACLMPARENSEDPFCVFSYAQPDQYGIHPAPLPTRALRTCRVEGINGSSTITKYGYEGACCHKNGRGFMGFKKTITETYRNSLDSAWRTRKVCQNEYSTMRELAMMLPQWERLFVNDNDTECLANEKTYCFYYIRYLITDFPKLVSCPAMSWQNEDIYSLDDTHELQKTVHTQYKYNFSQTSTYVNAYGCRETSQTVYGYFPSGMAYTEQKTVKRSELRTYPDTWILNRHDSDTITFTRNGESNSSHTVYEYGSNNRYEPCDVILIPNDGTQPTDPLTTKTHYVYDHFGNVTETTVSAPQGIHGEQPRTVSRLYGRAFQHRLLTSETHGDAADGYTTTYAYDFHDRLNYTRDCNRKVVSVETTPSGNDKATLLIDGTEQRSLVLWAGNSPYKPEGASYYTWDKSTGGQTSMTFYHKTGLELRSVSFGFNGTPVFVDKRYNTDGLLEKESAPYFQGEAEDSIRWTTYLYDNYDRPVAVNYPDSTVITSEYHGLRTITTTTSMDGDMQKTEKKLNAMGWLKESTEAKETQAPTSVFYEYYPDGSLKWTRIGGDEATKISLQYDHAGNRVLLHDPDYCTENVDLTSIYNAFGEEVSTTTPKNLTTTYLYDNLGRMTHRTEEEPSANGGTETKTTVWEYYSDDTEHHKGLLHSITYPGQTVTFTYNENQQVRKRVDDFGNNEAYTTRYFYDDASRLSRVLYPSSVYVDYHYNRHGYLKSHTGSGGVELYRTEKVNPMGQIERFVLGEDIISNRIYHAEKHLVTGIQTKKGENFLQDLTYVYDGFSNLASRTDNMRNLQETFTYDHLNRLTDIWLGETQTGWMHYDEYGRMTLKVADNHPVFSSAVYDATAKPHAIDEATTHDGVFTEQDLTYTCFDKVKTVTQGSSTLEYTYGYDRQRIFMEEHGTAGERAKRYVGNCERLSVTTVDDVSVRWHTCLVGPMGAYAMVVTDGSGVSTRHYILKDNLGSWSTVTDSSGVVEQELSFDAWGTLRNPETWRTWSGMPQPMFDRGYTGHEHLYAFGLINMNGRMYDPQMSSFLSVDAYVQSPENAQSFNRYAYCMNNPLRYTDPSGWLPLGPMPGNPFHDNWSRSFAEPVYEPRDFGLEQLPDNNEWGAWVQGEEMHGGGGDGKPSAQVVTDAGHGIKGSNNNCVIFDHDDETNCFAEDPPPGADINSGKNLLMKLFWHYQFGRKEDFWVDASTLNLDYISQRDLKYDVNTGKYSINLFDYSKTDQSALALGKISLIPIGNDYFEIDRDNYDFNIEWQNGLTARNVATAISGAIHGPVIDNIPIPVYWMGGKPCFIQPSVHFGGSFEIGFSKSVYIKP